MPTIQCPGCGRSIQYPESFAGGSVGCPGAGCGRTVELPNPDGTFPSKIPAPPPLPKGPRRSDKYYLRKQLDSSVVVGPLPLDRLRELVREGKVRTEDELSVDRKKWWQAERVEPELFGRGPAQPVCPTCGAALKSGETTCAACSADSPDRAAERGYGVGANSKSSRSLVAPAPIADFASAHSADAIVAVSREGWLGQYVVDEDRPRRTWTFDPADRVRVAVADEGGVAVVAATTADTTRLFLADFELRRLAEVAELDGPIRQIALDPEGEHCAVVDDATFLRLYRVEPWKRVEKLPVRGERFAFCLVRERMASADVQGRLFVWNLRNGKIERELVAGREAACPLTPFRLSFSETGTSLFAGTGYLVRPPAGILFRGPTDFQSWLIGGVPGMALVNNAEWIAKDIQKERWAETCKDLERVTRLRSWDVGSGELMADLSDVCSVHPAGIGGAYFSARRGVAVTVGPTDVRVWGLEVGASRGVIYNVTDPNDVRRAQEGIGKLKPLVRAVDFAHDGDNALILVEGAKGIRVVPLPRE